MSSQRERAMKPTDLRGILRYVPMFRDHVFVIAVDGSIVSHENFANIVTDIAVLRSLSIKVVLVHGIGQQLVGLAGEHNIALSDIQGEGPTDVSTMSLAREASALGILMNTRGLMELIVLNVGLDMHVISPTLFVMLVLMALITTFATTPVFDWLVRAPSMARALASAVERNEG